MIQANELRIGNSVLINHKSVKIEAITGCMVSVSGFESNRFTPFEIHKISAIHLTEEIILKCGFVMFNVGRLKHYGLCVGNIKFLFFDNIVQFGSNYNWSSYIRIEQLHQLQNLYFLLTNKELEVNL